MILSYGVGLKYHTLLVRSSYRPYYVCGCASPRCVHFVSSLGLCLLCLGLFMFSRAD